MKHAIRPLVVLLILLALLAWSASLIVDATSRAWFEQDVQLRGALALSGAHEALIQHWGEGNRRQVGRLLETIARDERILAAAACDDSLETFAKTPSFPAGLTCARVAHDAWIQGAPASERTTWGRIVNLAVGRVHVSAIPLHVATDHLGFVVLVHDMRFADLRAATYRRFTFAASGLFAAVVSLVTLMATRSSWRIWTSDLRRFVKGEPATREFQPVMRDLREMAQEIAAESLAEGRGLAWTPDRLRRSLRKYLHGEKVVLLANREPYIHVRDASGEIRVQHPASGLVTALEPVMRAFSGVWVAHGSGSADRDVVDRGGRVRVPPGEESYSIRRVWLTREEEEGYYYGFANEGLWPLCHIAHTRPIFRSEDWTHYWNVNQKFADTVCSEVDAPDPIIFVQDYHFALAPRMIRERLPRATIICFWHIPWPNSERFGICPWQQELVEGMLGGSILGFQVPLHANNFIETVDRYLEARIDHDERAVIHRGRSTRVRSYPISVEWPSRWLQGAPPAEECRREVFAMLGLPEDARLGIGVDRLDYTKGIEERFLAVERLLAIHPDLRRRFVLLQIAAPSRGAIERYKALRTSVEGLARRINERFGEGSYRPIILKIEHHEPPEIHRLYRAADVCLVTSLHDGMNLVAKEFVASRDDERGVLVLSTFTGAARELSEALIVNPYDLEECSAALAAALRMSAVEQQARMRAMRLYLSEFNVYRWAGQMLMDAARLRQTRRVRDRLTTAPPGNSDSASA